METRVLIVAYLCFAALLTVNAGRITGPRIVNGEIAQKGQFPWEVGIVVTRHSVRSYCSGAIISDTWILTAAHCVYMAEDILVYYNTLDMDDPDNTNFIRTRHWAMNSEYNNSTLRNDIGLIYLDSPLTLDDNVQAITLAEDEVSAGSEVTVIGWGSTGDDDHSEKHDVLRYITVNTIANEDCIMPSGINPIRESILCTDPGNPVKSPCIGDGGDPAVVNADSNPVHVGIFSFSSSNGCEDPEFPAGFISTAYFRDWIRGATGV